MKRTGILLIVLLFISVCAAQTTVTYDNFTGQWLNPAKWLTLPTCSGTIFLDRTASINPLDCARELQSNKLRLMVKAYGNPSSDQDRQFGPAELYFANPNRVNAIAANLQIRKLDAVGCSTNSTRSVGQVVVGGNYFNQGSGDPADDVAALLILERDPTDAPGIVRVMALVFSPNAFYGFTPLGTISLQEQAVAKVRWDISNKTFIIGISSDTLNASTTISYSGTDNIPPAIPVKVLAARAFVPNCTTAVSTANSDVIFNSISVNP